MWDPQRSTVDACSLTCRRSAAALSKRSRSSASRAILKQRNHVRMSSLAICFRTQRDH